MALNELFLFQLKFLQKSNEEQMEKLFNLLKYEPLVIHYYLQKTIFPCHMVKAILKLTYNCQIKILSSAESSKV